VTFKHLLGLPKSLSHQFALAVLLILAPLNEASAQFPLVFGGTGDEQIIDVGVGAAGDIVVTGTFAGALSFSGENGQTPIELRSQGRRDIFVVSYRPSGLVTWAKSFGGVGDDVVSALGLDAGGSIYLNGKTGNLGAAKFGSQEVAENAHFYARLDDAGDVLWASVSNVNEADTFDSGDLSVLSDGSYVISAFDRSTNGGTFFRARKENGILFDGVFTGTNSAQQSLDRVVSGSATEVFVLGPVDNSTSIARNYCGEVIPGNFVSPETYISKFNFTVIDPETDPDAGEWTCQWIKPVDTRNNVGDIVTDSRYVYYSASGRVVALTQALGNEVWVKAVSAQDRSLIFNPGMTSEDDAFASSFGGLATDGVGNIYISGVYSGSPTFPNVSAPSITLPETTIPSVFVAKLSPSREWSWVRAASRPDGSGVSPAERNNARIALSNSGGTVYLAGSTTGSLGFSVKEFSVKGESTDGELRFDGVDDRVVLPVAYNPPASSDILEFRLDLKYRAPAGIDPDKEMVLISNDEVHVTMDNNAFFITEASGTGVYPIDDVNVLDGNEHTIQIRRLVPGFANSRSVYEYFVFVDSANYRSQFSSGARDCAIPSCGLGLSQGFTMGQGVRQHFSGIRTDFPLLGTVDDIGLVLKVYDSSTNALTASPASFWGMNGALESDIIPDEISGSDILLSDLALSQRPIIELDRSLAPRDGFISAIDASSGEWLIPEPVTVGQAIEPPAGSLIEAPVVFIDGELASDSSEYIFWSPSDSRLYIIGEAPGSLTLRWRTSTDLDPENPERFTTRKLVSPVLPPPELVQTHIAGTKAILEPLHLPGDPDQPMRFAGQIYPSGSSAKVSDGRIFERSAPVGSQSDYVVLHYVVTNTADEEPSLLTQTPIFQVVYTKTWDDTEILQASNDCLIGSALTSTLHEDAGRNGHIVFDNARFDSVLHSRETGFGPIFPVNLSSRTDNAMAVVWYGENALGQTWGDRPVRYNCQWPQVGFGESDAKPIVIADQQGSGELPANYANATIYNQSNPDLPGFNANEEHALLLENTVFALRNDLNQVIAANDPLYASQPFTLLKYLDSNTENWAFKVYSVESRRDDAPFSPGVNNPVYVDNGLYTLTAGNLLQLPTPLRALGVCDQNAITDPNEAGWEDHTGSFWARSQGQVTAQYFYPLQNGFYYDLNNDGEPDQEPSGCVPWLDRLAGAPESTPVGTPVNVRYEFQWPDAVPVISPGETVFSSKETACSGPSDDPCFLPQINGRAAAQIIYDDTLEADGAGPSDSLVKLMDPISARSVELDALSGQLATVSQGGITYFSDLPFVIRNRLSYDPINKILSFNGSVDESQIGDPQLLPNIVTARERDRMLALPGADQAFTEAVNQLYHLSRNPNGLNLDGDPQEAADETYLVGVQPQYLGQGIDEDGDGVADNFLDEDNNRRDDRLDDPTFILPSTQFIVRAEDKTQPEPQALLGTPMALTAGRPTGEGYVTVAFNNDPSLGSLPVSLQILRMDNSNEVYQGNIWVVPSDNIFEEALTLRHSGDFAGDPDLVDFEWYYQPDTSGQPGSPPVPGDPVSPWIIHPDSGLGALDITIEGPGLLTLSDNWFITRYTNLGGAEYGNDVTPSAWAGDPSYDPAAPSSDPAIQARAMLATGWIKRVIAGLNPFDQRVKDFRDAEVNTLTSMIAQAGEPYAGPIPFNPDPDVVNGVGIIEAYQTVLERGKDLSINAGFDDIAANTQLLNVATRIADLYMLLGNEAYADAQDPTIGLEADSELGSVASSLFSFQNQLQSPLEEELVLLRGRDDSRAGVSGYPVNNRLFWNFTQGNGEVAYVQNYRITDQNKDGFITETDARALYPQGHGDAWGHYLSSVKSRYILLQEPNYTWKPRTESVLVAGVPIEVDYLDERKFAQAAAAKAKAGTEIINLTYREKYVEAPAGQWQGYKDTADKRDRAWGLDGWGRRAGQGAYFDWITANAILPAVDEINQGIEKVDRTTVVELSQIVDQYGAVQAQLDQADAGLNPLGLAKGVVPFDIDPNFLEVGSGIQGGSHFDQIAQRAQVALDNAVAVFNFANQQTQSVRSVQDDADELNNSVIQQERDYRNRLIEIFGYPYAGDIGGGKTYPSGYNGPDLYHYMYVSTELTGDLPPPDGTFTGFYSPIPFGGSDGFVFPGDAVSGAYENVGDTLEVEYPVAQGADWQFVAPSSWGKRRAPGKVQDTVSDLLQAQAQLQRALKSHGNLLLEITDAADLVKAEYSLNLEEISILEDRRDRTYDLNAGIVAARSANLVASTTADAISDAFDTATEGIPKVIGVANDAFSVARVGTLVSGIAATTPFNVAAAAAEVAELSLDVSKEAVELQSDIKLAQDTPNVALAERIKELEQLWREEALLRLELFTQSEVVNQSLGSYYEVLAEGQRLLEERRSFRVFTAGDVQANRYSDLTFRIFRNDALQKYRAQFDLAARYVYLAATAYDYETNLLGDDAGSGRKFLADIVRQRGLGQVIDGVPVAGTPGLADVLARLTQNFDIYRGQLGFNNPQVETNRFSLRYELFRKRLDPNDPNSNLVRLETRQEWRQKLEESRVDNLWDIPEFRRYARPFAPESAGPQPGLVIRFPTTINFGLNFFGRELGAGDSAYDPTNFATKVRAVGTWFEGYNDTGLSNTPRVYLLPVGMDIMRSPTGDTLATREWRVVDQRLPAPFPIGASDLTNPEWIPVNDSLSGTYAEIRRSSSYRAYHDSGEYDPAETASDTRLVGRSVWNTDWMLVIPGGTLNFQGDEGIDRLIQGQLTPDGTRDGNGITDIKLFFQTYGYSGN